MNKVPLIKPTLMGKKTIFKTDTIPTKGSNNIVTSDALAQALQDKVVNKEEEGEKTIVPTGDIVVGRLLEDGFYIEDPTFLGTRLIKIETPTPGKFYYDKTTRTYYTFRGYSETGYKFKPVVLSNLTELTWQELKDLRNDSRLIPGSLYRITDYQCTTTQENTRSAGHQFDIVLLALSENKLAEEGWAMQSNVVDMFNDYDIYTVTFSDGVSKQVYYKVIDGTPEEPDDEHRFIDTKTFLGNSIWHDPARDGFVINTENKTVTNAYVSSTEFESYFQTQYSYNYFQNSNLSAWKVWYCLDNDTSRFAWADDSVDESVPAKIITQGGKNYTFSAGGFFIRSEQYDEIITTEEIQESYYAWVKDDNNAIIAYTTSNPPLVNSYLYVKNRSGEFEQTSGNKVNEYIPAHEGTGLPNGRGIIYRLIDEFNNDIKYDFKNIQFKRTITDGQYDARGDETWCYTLNLWYNGCLDASIVGNTLLNDEGYITGVYDNKFGYATAHNLFIEGINTFSFALGGNVVLSFIDDEYYYGIHSNTIGDSFYFNTIGSNFYSNTIGSGFCYNIILNDFNRNIMGNDFSDNKIGNAFFYNNIGNSCNSNVIGNEVHDNTIGNYFNGRTISDDTFNKNYGNNGVELATKDDLN